MKTLLIISGISGSGKSTLAENLVYHTIGEYTDEKNGLPLYTESNAVICTADDFFIVAGEYKFDASKLSQAHNWCKKKCGIAMQQGVPLVIVNNTTTNKKDVKPYIDLAEKYGYQVHWILTLPHHDGKNIHNVPEAVLEKQFAALRNTVDTVHKEFLK